MDFKQTLDKTYKFYGVHDTSFKIGRHIFEAVARGTELIQRRYAVNLESIDTRSREII